MSGIAMPFVVVVVLIHLGIAYIEMVGWIKHGPKVFKFLEPELFEPTKGLAANQGLYNGFLAAGLIWALFISDLGWQHNIAVFFLLCVIAAGVYAAMTLSKKIVFVQSAPALVALITLYLFPAG